MRCSGSHCHDAAAAVSGDDFVVDFDKKDSSFDLNFVATFGYSKHYFELFVVVAAAAADRQRLRPQLLTQALCYI